MPTDASTPNPPQEQQDAQPRAGLRIAVTAAIILVALAIVGIIGRYTFLQNEFDLTTLLDDSAGIAPSSPVLLNGIDVGHVVRVTLSGSPDPDKTVRVVMRFPRRILSKIPDDSTVSITAANLLGDKYMNISRGKHPKHVIPGTEIPSTPTQDIGIVLARANQPLNHLNDIVARIDRISGYVDKKQGTIGKLINSQTIQQHVASASGHGAELLSNIQQGEGIAARLEDLKKEWQAPAARLAAIEGDIGQGKGTLGHLLHDTNEPDLPGEANATLQEARDLAASFNAGNRTTNVVNQLQQVTDRLDDVLARLEAGQGTLGQLMINPQLRDSLQHASKELNRLTADLKKHPTHFAQIRFGLF